MSSNAQACLALVVLAVVAIAGCERKPAGQPAAPATTPASAEVVVGYSAPEWGGGQHLIMEGFRARAREKGWRVIVVNANFDAEVQERQLQYLIEQKVNAIVAVPLDSRKIADSIRHAQSHGVLFYTIDRAPSEGKVNMVVQADNRLAGRQAGEAVVAALQARNNGVARGTVLELQGELTQTVAIERGEGFHEALKGQDQITVVQRETHWQAGLFGNLSREALQAEKIDAIYLHSDMIGVPEVLPVLKQMGLLYPREDPRHVVLVGVDGGPPALQAIREGFMDCAVSQPLTDYGIVVQFIEKALRGEKNPEGTVEQEGAPWSPARIVSKPYGPVLQMRTTPVDTKNVDVPALWGNQYDRVARKQRQE